MKEFKIEDFDINEFNNLKNQKWKLGNSVLYDLCKKHSSHDDEEEVRAKIWLIGRSYAVAIERRKINKHINDDFYDYAVKKFIKFNKETNFDRKLREIENLEFNENGIIKILKLHNELTIFFKEITGLEKRSLASKYLHFHNPLFPIYDSRAKKSLNDIIKGNIRHELGDAEYSYFCNKILFLYNYIKDNYNIVPTMREIDTFLVEVANKKMRADGVTEIETIGVLDEIIGDE